MEDIKQVLALFKSAEEWNSYIEISNLKDELVNELKKSLLEELKKISDERLKESGWIFNDLKNGILIVPDDSNMGVAIDFEYWKYGGIYSRSAIIHSCEEIDFSKLHELISQKRAELPLRDYSENNHGWEPYVKRIPAKVFGVSNEVTSIEQCLYRAKDDAKEMAEDIWKEVFEPFANKEVGSIIKSLIEELKSTK